MKIRIELEEDLAEDEIIIKCSKVNETTGKIQQAIQEVVKNTSKMPFYKEGKECYFPIDTVLFFESSNSAVDAHTDNDVYTVKFRLYELEEMLPKDFLRVSKSTILNINHIYSIEKNLTASSLVQFYESHKQVYVSRYYFKNLRRRLNERRNYEIW